MTTPYQQLDAWIDAHFDEEVTFLQALVQVPTDTPPGNNGRRPRDGGRLRPCAGGGGTVP